MSENNKSWSFQTDVTGLQAPNNQNKDIIIARGYYKANIKDMYEKSDKPGRITIRLEIESGRYVGGTLFSTLGIPKSPEDGVRYYWRALLESCGYTPERLDSGNIGLSAESFVGRTAHVYFTPREETTSGYPSVDFLTPDEWTAREKVFVPVDPPKVAAAAGGSPVLGASPAATTPLASTLGGPASNAQSVADLKARLAGN